MKFEGKGPTASRLAAWLNKLLAGALIKYITPGRGVRVAQAGEKGVVISTLAEMGQTFKLSESTTGNPSNMFLHGVNLNLDLSPIGASVEQTVYFTFARDFYGESESVRCILIGGQWEVISSGHIVARGTADAAIDQGDTGTITLAAPFGETDQITVTAEMFAVEEGDIVYARWISGEAKWYLDAIECPTTGGGGP